MKVYITLIRDGSQNSLFPCTMMYCLYIYSSFNSVLRAHYEEMHKELDVLKVDAIEKKLILKSGSSHYTNSHYADIILDTSVLESIAVFYILIQPTSFVKVEVVEGAYLYKELYRFRKGLGACLVSEGYDRGRISFGTCLAT